MKNIVLVLNLVAGLSLAQSIPDDIDHAKYRKIYESYKSVSDQKRSTADSDLATARSIDAQIGLLTDQIESNRVEISRLGSSITENNSQIENLVRTNQNLDSERQNLVSRINSNRSEISRLVSEMNGLTDQINSLDRRKTEWLVRLAEVDTEIQKIGEALHLTRRQLAERAQDSREAERVLEKERRDVVRLRQEIREIERQIPRLESQVSQLENQVASLEQRANAIGQRLRLAESELNQGKAEQNRLQQTVGAKSSELAAEKVKLDDLEDKVKRVSANVMETEMKIKFTRQQLKAAREEGNAEKIAKLEAELKELVEKHENQEARLSEFKNQKRESKARVEALEVELATAQTALNAQNTKVVALENEVKSLRSDLSEVQRPLEQARRNLQESRQELAHARASLPAKHRELNRAEAQVQEVQNRMAAIHADIRDLERRADHLERNHAEWQGRRAPIVREVDQLNYEIANRTEVYNRLLAQYDSRVADNKSSEARLQDVEYQLSSNQNKIQNLQAESQNAYAKIGQLEKSNVEHETRLTSLRVDSGQAWDRYERTDQIAKTAETETDTHYRAYAKVKANYDRLFNEAYAAGTHQGGPNGTNDGDRAGANVGQTTGQEEGNMFGEQMAGVLSYHNGLTQGRDDGKSSGYKAGYEAPENKERGLLAGIRAGQQEAKDEARATTYVQGRADQKKELLSKVPPNAVELDNGAVPSPLDGPQGLVDPDMASASPLNMMSVHSLQFEDADEKVSSLIRMNESQKAVLTKNMADLRGVKVFPGEINVDLEQAHCPQTYVDFIEACKSGYKTEYKKTYSAQYGTSYLELRNQTFDTAYPEALEKFKDSKLQAGYDEAYPIIFSKYEAIGAKDAENLGFTDGKIKGYRESIEAAKAEAYANGKVDESHYFTTNGVGRLLDAGIQPADAVRGFVPGSVVVLDLTTVNFGKAAIPRNAVKVVVTPLTRNIGFEKSTTGLVSVPGLSQARIKNVLLGRISPDAGWEEDVRVKVRVSFPDNVTEERVILLRTKFNLDLDLQVKTDLTPDIQNLFGYHEHEVKVTVTNKSKNVKGQKFAVMALPSPNFSRVKFSVKAVDLGALERGQTVQATLKYEIRESKYEGKKIPLTFQVIYGENLEVAKTEVVIKPKD